MSKRKVQIVVLSEDRAHEVLARRYLIGAGYHPRQIEYVTAPRGLGAGEQFVRARYPVEVTEYRRRNPFYWRLLVAIDADTGTTARRHAQLGASLANAGQPMRSDAEGIVHLIPRRNVETWIWNLLGNECDEITDYKSEFRNMPESTYCGPAASRLIECVRSTGCAIPLPSLMDGVNELRVQKLI